MENPQILRIKLHTSKLPMSQKKKNQNENQNSELN